MGFSLGSFLRSCPGAIAQGIIYGIMAMGVIVTYRILNYSDLTVDSSLCTGGAVTATLITAGVSPVVSLMCAFAAGLVAGTVTGLLHTALKIPAILSGIMTQLALYSINLRIMGKPNVTLLNTELLISLRNIPRAILIGGIFALSVIAGMYLFFGTEIGCSIRATGSNEKMASAQGINTSFNKVLALSVSNGITALAGGLIAQYQGYCDINMGRGAIVIALASIIIGEAIFSKVIETSKVSFAVRLFSAVFGASVYYLVITAVLQAGLNTSDLKLFSAAVVAVVLSLPHLKTVKKGKVKSDAQPE